MPVETLPIGRVFTMVDEITYALPGGRSMYGYAQNNIATMQESNDGTTWTAMTLDASQNFIANAAFIRNTEADTLVIIKGR